MKGQSYYINYKIKKRECGNCREVKPFDDFGFTPKGYPRTNCRPCASKLAYNCQQEKRLKLFPHIYMQCDDCLHIYNPKRVDHICKPEFDE